MLTDRYPKSPSVKKHKKLQWPISADPIRPLPRAPLGGRPRPAGSPPTPLLLLSLLLCLLLLRVLLLLLLLLLSLLLLLFLLLLLLLQLSLLLPERPAHQEHAVLLELGDLSEFRDVVFEDVVFDNKSFTKHDSSVYHNRW